MTLAVLLLVSGLAGAVAPGEWPMYRRDPQLTGRQPLPGAIASPRVAWAADLHVEEALYVAGASEDVLLDRPSDAFGLSPRRVQLVPGGPWQHVPLVPQVRVADVLPDVPGLETVSFDDAFAGGPDQRGHLFVHADGVERELWRTPPEDTMYVPLVILADATGDGRDEVCVATHYRVMVFDAATGTKLMECRYHGLRNYGYFGAADIDSDGFAEFITIADFASHIDVIDNDGQTLSLLWRRDIEAGITAKEKSIRVGPCPLLDVNGDGRLDLLLNVYNDAGDEQWHAVAIDARTGESVLDLPRRFVLGHVHLAGNGPPYLLLVETSRLPVPDYSTAEIVSGRDATVVASFGSATFATWEVADMPLHENTAAADGKRTALTADVDGDGQPEALVVRRTEDDVEVAAVSLDSTGAMVRWSVRGRRLTAIGRGDCDGDAGDEVLLATRGIREASPAVGYGVYVRSAGRSRVASPLTSPVFVSQPDGQGLVIAEAGTEELVALAPHRGDVEPAVAWVRPGRGLTDSADPRFGVVCADVDEDGTPEVIAADRSPFGCARLVAYGVGGEEKWHHDFPHIPAAPPRWNVGGLTYWWPVRTADGTAVFASVRRSTMHSDEGYLLDGATGAVRWRQVRVAPPVSHDVRGYGGKLVASADLDGDGAEEIVCFYPDMGWIADSGDGRVRRCVNTADGSVFGGWTAYATPVAADFLGNGSLQLLWAGCTYVTGLLDAELSALWTGPWGDAYGKQGVCVQAVGDFEGRGSLDIVERGRDGLLRCLTGADGTERWSLRTDPISGALVSCDIDGDGRDEALAVSGDQLVAYGAATVRWSLDLPALGHTPAIADVDGDGLSEVLVALQDGSVLCVDAQEGG